MLTIVMQKSIVRNNIIKSYNRDKSIKSYLERVGIGESQ